MNSRSKQCRQPNANSSSAPRSPAPVFFAALFARPCRRATQVIAATVCVVRLAITATQTSKKSFNARASNQFQKRCVDLIQPSIANTDGDIALWDQTSGKTMFQSIERPTACA